MIKVKILNCGNQTAKDTYGYEYGTYLGKGSFVDRKDDKVKEYYIVKLPTGEIINIVTQYGQLIVNGDVGDLI